MPEPATEVEVATKSYLLRHEDGTLLGDSFPAGESFTKYDPTSHQTGKVETRQNVRFGLKSKLEMGVIIRKKISDEEAPHYFEVVEPLSKEGPDDIYVKRILLKDFEELKDERQVINFQELDFTEETKDQLFGIRKSRNLTPHMRHSLVTLCHES